MAAPRVDAKLMDTLAIFTVCCIAYLLSAVVLVVGAGIRRLWERIGR